MSKAKVRTTNPHCTLDDVVRMVKSAMPYVDGSASVTFTVKGAGSMLTVSEFKLENNHDAPREERERAYFEDDEGGRGGIPR